MPQRASLLNTCIFFFFSFVFFFLVNAFSLFTRGQPLLCIVSPYFCPWRPIHATLTPAITTCIMLFNKNASKRSAINVLHTEFDKLSALSLSVHTMPFILGTDFVALLWTHPNKLISSLYSVDLLNVQPDYALVQWNHRTPI